MTSLLDSTGFWAAVIGGITGITGLVVGRKSKPLDEADTAARLGEAWDKLVVQLNTRNEQILKDNAHIHDENEKLRKKVEKLEQTVDEQDEKLRLIEEKFRYNAHRHDTLIAYLSELGLEAPPDIEDMPV